MIKKGKKTLAWDRIRSKLKKQFERWEITSCELRLSGCQVNNFLGFAHIDKRRNLKPEELTAVVLCCVNCHEKVEYNPQMRSILTRVIKARNQLLQFRGEVNFDV